MKKDTSWQRVATWYDNLLEGEGTYQKDLILPNLIRIVHIHKGETVLDVACGQGFFAREFAAQGAHVTAVDASSQLIALAKKNSPKEIHFYLAKADAIPFVKKETIDKAVVVLALQNIENVQGVLHECGRALKKGGTLTIVMNHPAFRVPKASSWEWDEKNKTQYRRVDKYLSESKIEIDMHPGKRSSDTTVTFHRPFQFYFKALAKAGFAVTGMEEWNSNRKSQPGPRAAAEDVIRKEIPLFVCITADKR